VPTGLGLRFLVEAAFIIAVAAVAGVERFRTVVIIAVVAAAWAVVAAIELVLEVRRRIRRRAAAPAGSPAASDTWVRAEREPEPAPEPVATPALSAEPEEEPEPEAPPAPEPARPAPAPAPPRVVATVPPEPELEREAAEPEAERAVVSLASRRGGPREWNVWDLERLARERVSDDVARNEERSYLLMYLREFANAEGVLPADFDGVVRETFGDVLDAAYTS
jgi:hypothetical protein